MTAWLTRRQLIGVGALGALFVALFWPTFGWMAERFDAYDSFYSHGWLIPVASGWLIWQRRERVAALASGGSFAGLLLLIPSALVQVIAAALDIGFVQGFAMLGVIYGLVWTCLGPAVLWILRFPLLFLLFMVPLPGVLLIAVSFKMKLAAAALATAFLNLIGMRAIQAGSTIHVPGVSVIVDDTCSGLRSLISLIALSTLWTALMPEKSKWWQRGVVVLSSIPIALVANMARIVIMVLLSAIYGAYIADTFVHAGSGIVVFGVAVAVLMWLSRAVQRWSWPTFNPRRLPSSS